MGGPLTRPEPPATVQTFIRDPPNTAPLKSNPNTLYFKPTSTLKTWRWVPYLWARQLLTTPFFSPLYPCIPQIFIFFPSNKKKELITFLNFLWETKRKKKMEKEKKRRCLWPAMSCKEVMDNRVLSGWTENAESMGRSLWPNSWLEE